ncbi:MAG: hypothetical protein SVC26_02595 [Pseudomonadota bacterium]|nr:hypothetical protein [Pseudomonadota bacterium]
MKKLLLVATATAFCASAFAEHHMASAEMAKEEGIQAAQTVQSKVKDTIEGEIGDKKKLSFEMAEEMQDEAHGMGDHSEHDLHHKHDK